MRRMRRSTRLVAVACGLSLVVAACGGDDDDDDSAATEPRRRPRHRADTEAPATTTAGTEAPGTTEAGGEARGPTAGGEAPAGDAAMTVTVNLNPDAVWQDGSPITVADLECSWRAALNTPGSILTAGYDKITAVTEGESDKQAIIEFSEVYGPYKTLFDRIIQASAVENCDDISGDFETEMPLSAAPYMIESWSESQSSLVPNPNYWGDAPVTERSSWCRRPTRTPRSPRSWPVRSTSSTRSSPTRSARRASTTRTSSSASSSAATTRRFYFQQLEGPFADPCSARRSPSRSTARRCSSRSTTRSTPRRRRGRAAQLRPDRPGPVLPRGHLPETPTTPTAPSELLTGDGWTKNGDGLWEKDGTVPRDPLDDQHRQPAP